MPRPFNYDLQDAAHIIFLDKSYDIRAIPNVPRIIPPGPNRSQWLQGVATASNFANFAFDRNNQNHIDWALLGYPLGVFGFPVPGWQRDDPNGIQFAVTSAEQFLLTPARRAQQDNQGRHNPPPPSADPAFAARTAAYANGQERIDASNGRFICRHANQLTARCVQQLDDILRDIYTATGLTALEFLEEIFNGWNTAMTPGMMPRMDKRKSADVVEQIGVWECDCAPREVPPAIAEGSDVPATRPKGPTHYSGAPAFLSVSGSSIGPLTTICCKGKKLACAFNIKPIKGIDSTQAWAAALAELNAADQKRAHSFNRAALMFKARSRLRHWYQVAPPTPKTTYPNYFPCATEPQVKLEEYVNPVTFLLGVLEHLVHYAPDLVEGTRGCE